MGRRRVWGIFLRSLLVQASWSFQRMQGAGFFLMVWPEQRRRHRGDPAALARAGVRSLRHFNTHPCFGGLVAATVLREEADGREPSQTDELARTLASTLGAVGDEFFWAHLRPLAALAALPAALAGLWWAPLVLLAVYDVPHLALRWWGVAAGLERGRGILALLQRRWPSRAVPALGLALGVGAGFLVGALPAHPSLALVPGSLPRSAAAAVAVFALLAALFSRGLRPGRLLAGAVAVAVAGGALALVAAP